MMRLKLQTKRFACRLTSLRVAWIPIGGVASIVLAQSAGGFEPVRVRPLVPETDLAEMSRPRMDAIRPLDDSETDWSTLHIYTFPYRNQQPRRMTTEGQLTPSIAPATSLATSRAGQQMSIPRPDATEESGAWPQLFVLPSPQRWVEEAVVEMETVHSDDVAAVTMNAGEDQQQKWAPLHIPSSIQIATAQATIKVTGSSTFRLSSASTKKPATSGGESEK